MLSFFRQPFPIDEPNLVRVLLQSVMIGAFVTFVLIVFQPFGSYNWQHSYKNIILLGYGGVASLTTLVNFYTVPKIVSILFAEKQWTIWKEIIWNLAPCILGGFLSVVYGNLIGAMPFTLTQISYMVVVVFLVGLFPAIILILLKYVYLIRKYRPIDQQPDTTVSGTEPEHLAIELVADNGKDRLVLTVAQLVCIEASDNYCTIFHLVNGMLTKTLLRSSLSRMESQIAAPEIVRCHRSFIVNFTQVKQVSGNAQGYRLHLTHMNFTVPVARTYSSRLKEQLVSG